MNCIHRSRRARAERRGTALIAALAVVLLVGALSVAYLQMSMSKNREQKGAADAKRAFYMAESGLSEAYVGMVVGQSGNVGSDVMPVQFGNGIFWVVAEPLGGHKTCLTSTGLCGSGRASISIVVEDQTESVASRGAFGDHSVTLRAGSIVDSYDSRSGSYLSQVGNLVGGVVQGLGGALGGLGLGGGGGGGGVPSPSPSTGARVGSNGSITLQGSTSRTSGATVYGDAHPGPNGMVVSGTGATITGATTPSTMAVELPDVRFPDVVQSGDLAYNRPSPPLDVQTGTNGYHSLTLTGTGVATIHGPTTLVLDQLVLGPSTKLSIDTSGGPVKILVRDWMQLQPGSTIECSSTDPSKLSLACAGSAEIDRSGDGIADPPVSIGATGTFYGSIYAPNAGFTIPSTFELFGAVSAKDLTIGSSAKVHFDRAFLDAENPDGAVPRELCWRLVQLPPAEIVQSRLDPITFLKVRSIVPKKSKDGHLDIGIAPITAITRAWDRLFSPRVPN